mmetsp:Transcript_35529/g.58213  ORF Transcript_35529/g.58213 Transcript_35529/m.58213 type:complete len:309 (+) Transcript_35529:1498-2424(+)
MSDASVREMHKLPFVQHNHAAMCHSAQHQKLLPIKSPRNGVIKAQQHIHVVHHGSCDARQSFGYHLNIVIASLQFAIGHRSRVIRATRLFARQMRIEILNTAFEFRIQHGQRMSVGPRHNIHAAQVVHFPRVQIVHKLRLALLLRLDAIHHFLAHATIRPRHTHQRPLQRRILKVALAIHHHIEATHLVQDMTHFLIVHVDIVTRTTRHILHRRVPLRWQLGECGENLRVTRTSTQFDLYQRNVVALKLDQIKVEPLCLSCSARHFDRLADGNLSHGDRCCTSADRALRENRSEICFHGKSLLRKLQV